MALPLHFISNVHQDFPATNAKGSSFDSLPRAGLTLFSYGKQKSGDRSDTRKCEGKKYWIRLNTIIKHSRLPIETWVVKDAAY